MTAFDVTIRAHYTIAVRYTARLPYTSHEICPREDDRLSSIQLAIVVLSCKYDREAPNFGNACEYDSCV